MKQTKEEIRNEELGVTHHWLPVYQINLWHLVVQVIPGIQGILHFQVVLWNQWLPVAQVLH